MTNHDEEFVSIYKKTINTLQVAQASGDLDLIPEHDYLVLLVELYTTHTMLMC